LHYNWKEYDEESILANSEFREASTHPEFKNFNEQLTILGLPSDQGHLLCENKIRCEFDLLPLASHKGSEFLPYTPADQSDIHTPYLDGMRDELGATRLGNAVYLGVIKEVSKLLDAGAKINAPAYKNHFTPLMIALINKNFPLAYYLIERGANLTRAAKKYIPGNKRAELVAFAKKYRMERADSLVVPEGQSRKRRAEEV
jgi:ankyrin repeat protein